MELVVTVAWWLGVVCVCAVLVMVVLLVALSLSMKDVARLLDEDVRRSSQ